MDKPKDIKIGFSFSAGIVTASTALFFFGWLAKELLEADTTQFDEFVRTTIRRLASPKLSGTMEVFSFLGSVAFMAGMTVLAIGLFIYFHHALAAKMLVHTMAGGVVLNEVLKYTFQRSRPVAFFGTSPTSSSFPNGHALGSMCFYGALAVILSARIATRAAQIFIYSGALLLVGAIGVSRVYLGVHYPSDVIAGYLAGIFWVGAVGLTLKHFPGQGADGPERLGSASKSS